MFPNIKLYLEIGAALVLITVSIWFVHHERDIGRQQIVATDAKVAAAQIIHNTEVETRAKQLTHSSVAEYKAQLARPPANPVHVWVRHDASTSGAVPANASTGSGAHGNTGISDPVGSNDQDIGPPTDKLFEQCSAQVSALQAYIKTCQEVGICHQ